MQPAGLLDALKRVPRRRLGTYPTPLLRLESLSRELGREVWVKRDDGLGPAAGGNKTRKLEYLLADAIEAGAEKIVTVGGPQSNHARLTAAAARILGLEPHLLLFGSEPNRAVGNLLLDQLIGADAELLTIFLPVRGSRVVLQSGDPVGVQFVDTCGDSVSLL